MVLNQLILSVDYSRVKESLNKMTELVEYIVEHLIPDGEYVIENRDGEKGPEIVIIVAKHDIGKIIGKKGRIAKSIRTLVKAANGDNPVHYNIIIEEQPEQNEE